MELELELELELEPEPEMEMEWGYRWEAAFFEGLKLPFLTQVYGDSQWQRLSLCFYHCSRSEPAKVPALPSRTDPQMRPSTTLQDF